MMVEAAIKPAKLNLALSGQMIYTRFFKVAIDTPAQVKQMVQFEVEQNVPFPMSEVVWGYQLVGEPDAGEQQVMIVAAKKDVVNAVTRAITNVGLEPEIVDVAHLAIYNAVRYNYPDLEGCSLVVDIGARSTNLIFVDKESIYCRTLPVAGNTVTTEIAKAFNISHEEAEQLKRDSGLVARGGAFVVEDPEVDRLSKVIRNVMTRLNAEIVRSINFYRSQQGGAAPVRIMLTGGAAQLPYLKEFVLEKTTGEVSFLNPFNQVEYDASIDAEQFGVDVFSLSDLVGLALRRSLACPIEINLLSDELIARKLFRKKIPFFVVTVVGFLIMTACWLGYIARMTSIYTVQATQIKASIDRYQVAESRMQKEIKSVDELVLTADALETLIADKFRWNDIIKAINKATPDGMWVQELKGNKPTVVRTAPATGRRRPAARTSEVKASNITGLTLIFCGWKIDVDQGTLKQRTQNNRTITVGDYIIQNLAASPVFADEKGVELRRGSSFGGDVDQWLYRFTINANFTTPVPAQTDRNQRGSR